MTSFALKIKTKDGQQILRTLTSTSTVSDLKQQLFNICSIPTCRLHVLSGFPPKSFDLSKDDQELGDAGLSTGDTLIVEEKSDNKSVTNISQDKDAKPVPALEPQAKHHVSNNEPARNGILLKQVVPADNSCLFTSIYFVLNGKIDQTGDVSKLMRQHVAETISREPYNYTDAFLGKPNEEYCKWILDDKSWGGAIEISVMSSHYGIEIAVVDTINGIINRFGEDQKYAHRVLLFFDGIHYDPLYLEPFHVSLQISLVET